MTRIYKEKLKPKEFWKKGIYIKLRKGEKMPLESGWSGTNPSLDSDATYSYEEVIQSDRDNWAIVGYDDKNLDLLVLDADFYKIENDEKRREKLDAEISRTLISKSPDKASYHFYFLVPSGLSLPTFIDEIDRKGEAGGGYVVIPWTPYESPKAIVSEDSPAIISEKEAFPDSWIMEYEPSFYEGDFEPVDIDIEEAPPCFDVAVNELENEAYGSRIHDINMFVLWFLKNTKKSDDEILGFFKKHSKRYTEREEYSLEDVKNYLEHWDSRKYSTHGCEKVKKELGVCPEECGQNHPLDVKKEFDLDIPRITKDTPLKELRKISESVIRQAYEQGRNILLKVLQGVGKTFPAVKEGLKREETLVFFSDRHEFLDEIQALALRLDSDTNILRLEGAGRKCPSLNGEIDCEDAKRAKALYKMEVSPRVLHKKLELPCDGDCPWSEQFTDDYTKYDLVLAPFEYVYLPNLLRKANVVLDEGAFQHFIQKFNIDTNFEGPNKEIFGKVRYSDNYRIHVDEDHILIRKIKTETKDGHNWPMMCLEKIWTTGEFLDYCIENDVHPKLPEYLRVVEEGEKFYDESDGCPTLYREFEKGTRKMAVAGENPELRINDKPSFRYANSVVALDAEADPKFWRLYVSGSLEFVNLDKVVRNELPWTVKKHTRNMNYVCNTTSEIHEDERYLEALKDFDGAVVTSKRIAKKLLEKGVVSEEQLAYYYNLKGTNRLMEYNKIALLGAPHPGHESIMKEAVFAFGTEVHPEGRGRV